MGGKGAIRELHYGHMFLSEGRKCEKRGQESDVSEIGKKRGNDMLVPVKTPESLEVKERGAKIHFEHMN